MCVIIIIIIVHIFIHYIPLYIYAGSNGFNVGFNGFNVGMIDVGRALNVVDADIAMNDDAI